MSTQDEIDEEKKLFTTPTFNATRASFENRNSPKSRLGDKTVPVAPKTRANASTKKPVEPQFGRATNPGNRVQRALAKQKANRG